MDRMSGNNERVWECCFLSGKRYGIAALFTPEGIHILKVMDREETAAYENVSARLMERLRRKEILDKGTGAVLERLKKAWQYAPNQAAMEELLAKGRTEQTLFTIDGQAYTGTMFTHFASSHPQAVKRQLEGFIAKSLLDYESRNIDKSIRKFLMPCGNLMKTIWWKR